MAARSAKEARETKPIRLSLEKLARLPLFDCEKQEF
jgi:hypothetical protein